MRKSMDAFIDLGKDVVNLQPDQVRYGISEPNQLDQQVLRIFVPQTLVDLQMSSLGHTPDEYVCVYQVRDPKHGSRQLLGRFESTPINLDKGEGFYYSPLKTK